MDSYENPEFTDEYQPYSDEDNQGEFTESEAEQLWATGDGGMLDTGGQNASHFESKGQIPSETIYENQAGQLSGSCQCNPCQCDDTQSPDGPICVCDPCECDPPPVVECTCDPCECDAPPPEECVCNPCTCDAPTPAECTCNPCECDLPPDCTCDVCPCDIPPEQNEPPFDQFSPRNDNEKSFFDKLQQNLIDNQKEYCSKIFPKPAGSELTEELVIKLLIRESNGKSQMYLPGNQLYPAILKRRIEDKDIPCIIHVLLQYRSISTLNLAYNNITDEGIALLASTIQECRHVEHINLMNNDITSVGTIALVKALLYRLPLESLRLSGNKIGMEGFDGFASLIMSGHCPRNLDLSECDLNVEGFQAFCSALHAVDHGIDFPVFLMNRELPVDLRVLKSIKRQHNDEAGRMDAMHRTSSETNYLANIYNIVKCEDKPVATAVIENPLTEAMEEFSASVLQGLIGISHRLSEETIPVETLQNEYKDKAAAGILGQSTQMADVEEMIAEYIDVKNSEDVANPIVSPSLYELDHLGKNMFIDDFNDDSIPLPTQVESVQATPKVSKSLSKKSLRAGEKGDSKKSQAQETIFGITSFMDDTDDTVDEATSSKVAQQMQEFVFTAAGERAGRIEVPDITDVVQLVLMSFADVAQLQKTREEAGIDFTEEECMEFLENALEAVTNLLSPQVPPQCQLDDAAIRDFVTAFFKSSHKTFLKLFQNPYICMALAEEGTIACQEKEIRDAQELIRPFVPFPTEVEIRYIATQFLDGAIKEAARLIGTGDPFGLNTKYQKESEDFSHALKILLSTESTVQMEDDLQGVIQGLIETSGQIAAATKAKALEIHEADKEYKMISEYFVDDLFDQVAKAINDYKLRKMEKYLEGQKAKDLNKTRLMGRYPYASRPARLVLNRPFFHNNAELMGAKMGDWIRDNTSIEALHLQKWNLGEDGMAQLMAGVLLNTSLVLLDLANNELAADGVKLLGEYLQVNKNLKHLILNHNRLRDPGILHIVENLEGSGLRSLNIAFNNLTWVGLDPLLTVLPNTNLKALYLWGNSFGFTTWDLLNSLMQNGVLRHTDICLQMVDGSGCIVKSSQFRDTNYWYEVPPIVEKELYIPTYYSDPVIKRNIR